MKKKNQAVSASEIIDMLEFLHSGISWLPSGKTAKNSVHKATIGTTEVSYFPKTETLEFRGSLWWASISVPNENTAKRLVSSIKANLQEVKNTNGLLLCLHPSINDLDIKLNAFWGL